MRRLAAWQRTAVRSRRLPGIRACDTPKKGRKEKGESRGAWWRIPCSDLASCAIILCPITTLSALARNRTEPRDGTDQSAFRKRMEKKKKKEMMMMNESCGRSKRSHLMSPRPSSSELAHGPPTHGPPSPPPPPPRSLALKPPISTLALARHATDATEMRRRIAFPGRRETTASNMINLHLPLSGGLKDRGRRRVAASHVKHASLARGRGAAASHPVPRPRA